MSMLWENLHFFLKFLCLSEVSFWQLWSICCAGCIVLGHFLAFVRVLRLEQHILAGQVIDFQLPGIAQTLNNHVIPLTIDVLKS
jgi:hypothetical protein